MLLILVLTLSSSHPEAPAQLFFSLKARRQQLATLLTSILLGKAQVRVICQAPQRENPSSGHTAGQPGVTVEVCMKSLAVAMLTTMEEHGSNLNTSAHVLKLHTV